MSRVSVTLFHIYFRTVSNTGLLSQLISQRFNFISNFRYGEEMTEYDDTRTKDDIIKFVKL